MASWTDKLNREEWKPQPGDELIGTITSITERESQYGWYPVIAIAQDETGTVFEINAARGGILDDVIAHKPKPGDKIGLRFVGPQEKPNGSTWDKFTVAFEDEGNTEPDWERMAKSRNANRKGRFSQAGSGEFPPEPSDDAWG